MGVRSKIAIFLMVLGLLACGQRGELSGIADLLPADQVNAALPAYSEVPLVSASSTARPRPRPTPPATGSVFLGIVGSSVGPGALADPQRLACGGGSLFVADAHRPGPSGHSGAVLRFDPGTGQLQAIYEARTATMSLPADLSGVAVATSSAGPREIATFVYAFSQWGIFGFVADKLWSLNLGKPYAPGGQDLVLDGQRAWVAENEAVHPYRLPDWLPDDMTPSLYLRDIRGMALADDSMLWLAAPGKVYRGESPFVPTAEAPVDPRDVALDPQTGQVLVLERDRVCRYDPDGTFKGRFGTERIRDGFSLAIGEDGSVYISDRSARAIYRYAPP